MMMMKIYLELHQKLRRDIKGVDILCANRYKEGIEYSFVIVTILYIKTNVIVIVNYVPAITATINY